MTINAYSTKLPTHHLTIRVPWHDTGWDGHVCSSPMDNSSCLILPRIGEGKNDQEELACAGRKISELRIDQYPPCVSERMSFMANFDIIKHLIHPYVDIFPETHSHFLKTPFTYYRYSAACIPFRWMLKETIEGENGLAERLKLDFNPEREPILKTSYGKVADTPWIQERGNQLASLDTFFSAIHPKESLCFFYAKRTPLSDQTRRVIIGVGRVLSVAEHSDHHFECDNPPLRSAIWERNVGHSIRPDFKDGFLFPYQDLLALAKEDKLQDLENYIAFAPDELFSSYSYGTEHLTHDGAVSSLIACAAALHKIKKVHDGHWDHVLSWIDTELNRLWKARGAFPGLGSAISAFGMQYGFQYGSLLAYEVDLHREKTGHDNPWSFLDEVMDDPIKLNSPVVKYLQKSFRSGWKELSKERRKFLELISRCALNEEQALRIFDKDERGRFQIDIDDKEFLANPYLFFECDRYSEDPIPFAVVDRGLFPDASVQQEFPIPEPSIVTDPVDDRRVRALTIDLLEQAGTQGHSLLPRSWLVRLARERSMQPPCPLGNDVLEAKEASFGEVITCVQTKGGEKSYQLDRLSRCGEIIRKEVLKRYKGKRHKGDKPWRILVDDGLNQPMPKDPEEKTKEEMAREEKAHALRELFQSRISVLIGTAGTGKTTLLRMLCNLPEVKDKLLLLAPTGKARVRLQQSVGEDHTGYTLAQFLHRYRRYNIKTGTYLVTGTTPRAGDYATVVIDECSMLTEEQLAALFDACANVERYVLVGDPRQLPPIGSGRPFVDIVNKLKPESFNTPHPKCSPCYAELTVSCRQKDTKGLDVLLASHFSGNPLDPGADEIWDERQERNNRVRMVQWNDPSHLQQVLLHEIVAGLNLADENDELGFEMSLGGSKYKEMDRAFFWNKFGDNPGAALKADSWQILTPIRGGLEGVDALNRSIQERFRQGWRNNAVNGGRYRKIPHPFGPQGILYGDKVINIVNQLRRDVYPERNDAYIANGDIGIVVGQYKTKNFKKMPRKIEVEFVGQLSTKYGFSKKEFGDEAKNPLELAYALTVHKTQGSEFKTTFVILPNPCWLLTRELLYTALTRHSERLVILHRGPFIDFRRFASEEYSEIARRLTNLFEAPNPKEFTFTTQSIFLEQGLIHRTERGELVRSKSELVIADKLHARGIDYAYEQPLNLSDGKRRYPDFTVADHATGNTYYWEHLGMLADQGYAERWERKKAEYLAYGIVPWEQGGGENGTLIETKDGPDGGLDSGAITELIEKIFQDD